MLYYFSCLVPFGPLLFLSFPYFLSFLQLIFSESSCLALMRPFFPEVLGSFYVIQLLFILRLNPFIVSLYLTILLYDKQQKVITQLEVKLLQRHLELYLSFFVFHILSNYRF